MLVGDSATHKSDIYSLGVVLAEMLAREIPHAAKSAPEVVVAVIHNQRTTKYLLMQSRLRTISLQIVKLL